MLVWFDEDDNNIILKKFLKFIIFFKIDNFIDDLN